MPEGYPEDSQSNNIKPGLKPDVLICRIYINPLNSVRPEYLALYNPSALTIDLSGYSIDQGVSFIFPEGIFLAPGDTLYVSSGLSGWNPNQNAT